MFDLKSGLTASALAVGLLLSSGTSELSAQPDAWIESSYEVLTLPETNFINQYRILAPSVLVVNQTFENHDGKVDGLRLDAGLTEVIGLNGGMSAGINGFFAWHESGNTILCPGGAAGTSILCSPIPLFDPDPASGNVIIGSAANFDEQLYTTSRDVNHWGTALEVNKKGPLGLKAGAAFRRIDQDLTITGFSTRDLAGNTRDTFELTYTEDLETNYWGAFIGSNVKASFGRGWTMSYDAEAGLYWADTDYDGHYVVVNSSFPVGDLNQRLSLESDDLAAIASLKLKVEKDFGNWKLAAFGQGEFISYAPKMRYNDNDEDQNSVRGPDAGTSITDDIAYNFSVGARITVPFGSSDKYDPGAYDRGNVPMGKYSAKISKQARVIEIENQIADLQKKLKELKQ